MGITIDPVPIIALIVAIAATYFISRSDTKRILKWISREILAMVWASHKALREKRDITVNDVSGGRQMALFFYPNPKSRSKQVSAYVMVGVKPDAVRDVLQTISKIEGVKVAHAVAGRFDIVVYVEVPDHKALHELVLKKIQTLKGVKRTETSIVF